LKKSKAESIHPFRFRKYYVGIEAFDGRINDHDSVKTLKAASKPSIGFKVKAERDGQPHEYKRYFED